MTLHYLDSSAWIKRYCLETGSEWMGNFFAQAPALACSAVGMIEVLSTLARKKKARELGLAEFREKSREAERDFALFHQIYLTPELLALACSLAMKHALRGADTVHLASACFLRDRIGDDETEVRMITCDVELSAAARNCGFSVINPEDEVQPSEWALSRKLVADLRVSRKTVLQNRETSCSILVKHVSHQSRRPCDDDDIDGAGTNGDPGPDPEGSRPEI